MSQPSDPITIAFNLVNAEISNRQFQLQELREKRLRIEGEIAGLRGAQDHFRDAAKDLGGLEQ